MDNEPVCNYFYMCVNAFLMLEGDKTNSVRERIFRILKKYGLKES